MFCIDLDLFNHRKGNMRHITLFFIAYIFACSSTISPVSGRNCTVHDVGKDIIHWNAGLHIMEWDIKDCTRLVARHLKLNDTHIVPLAEHLEGNKILKHIDLGHNHMRDDSAIAFAKVLEHRHTALERLNLEGNDIGCGGIKSLAHAIKENVNLKMLELGRNHIHPDGAKALAQAIRINHVLRELDIEHNAFGVEGEIIGLLKLLSIVAKMIDTLENPAPIIISAPFPPNAFVITLPANIAPCFGLPSVS